MYFMEKIKISQDRVNLTKLTANDNSSPNITGGYIIKADKINSDPIAWVMNGVIFLHDNPSPLLITNEQKNYI